jgi:hypothetical protein
MTKLTIAFGGLCLFVTNKASDELHVFLPRAPGTGTGGGPKEAHFAAMVYAHPSAPAVGKKIPIDQTRFDFPTKPGTASIAFGDGIENLSRYWDPKAKVLEDLMSGGRKDLVNTHLVIPGGKATAVGRRGYWEVDLPSGTETVSLAPWVFCEATLSSRFLDLPSALTEGIDMGLDELTAGPDIVMGVMHVEWEDLKPNPAEPPHPKPGDKSDHFPGYFKLFGKTSGPDLRFVSADPATAATKKSKALLASIPAKTLGISPFTCMAGGGEPGP